MSVTNPEKSPCPYLRNLPMGVGIGPETSVKRWNTFNYRISMYLRLII